MAILVVYLTFPAIAMPPPIQLADVIALNRHVRVLSDAGLPIDFGPTHSSGTMQETLDGIVSRLAVQQAQGQTIESTLEADKSIPPAYRLALNNWTRGSEGAAMLSPLQDAAVLREGMRSQLKYSLLHPMFILLLVYGGFLYLTLVIEPKVIAIYSQLRQPPGPWISVVSWLRMTLPVWSIAVPGLIGLAYMGLRRKTLIDRLQYTLPRANEPRLIGLSHFAQAVAMLVQQGYSVDEAIKGGKDIGCLENRTLSSQTPDALESEPLIRWAIAQDSSKSSQVSALMFASQVYQESMRIQSRRWQRWLPIALTALLGGAMVLAFALGIFGPLVELLFTLLRG